MNPILSNQNIIDDGNGKRERTKHANREAILDAARKVFAELGFEATTVRDIIRGTDLASGTFYNYFKSKEEVFDELAVSSVGRFRPYLKDVRNNTNSLEGYLNGAFAAFFQFLLSFKDDMITVQSVTRPRLMGLRVDTPEMQAIFHEIRSDIEDFLSLQGAVDIDTEYLTAAAIGLARELGQCMLTRDEEDGALLVERTADFATSLVLNGVKGQLNIR